MPDSRTDSEETESTASTTHTETSGTTVAIGKAPPTKSSKDNPNEGLPQVLPSHKFQYSVWHDLRESCLRGDELHAPRVRDGPPEKDKLFYKVEEEGSPIHHALRGTPRHNHMVQLENWENTQAVNLSYQELHHDYQNRNFYRVLHRLLSAVTVNLVSNSITTLKKHQFPRCEYLNLNKNYINSFLFLPSTPNIKCLSVEENAITTLKYLDRYLSTRLRELSLKGNPVSFTVNYRQRVFSMLPGLQILDGIPRLASDGMFHDESDLYPNGDRDSCSIV